MKKGGQENVHHLFQCLYTLGVRHIFICPGSRNAPLINGAVSHNGFELHSVVDERAAGYMALGAAQITQVPVVIICTSGTALLNLFPAVAEAHQLHVPLIVLSADRPLLLLDCWENQSIHQKRVFGKYANKYIEWKGLLESKRALGKVDRIASKILTYSQFPDKGVVHVNFHFSEPLYFHEPISIYNPFSLVKTNKQFTAPIFHNHSVKTGRSLMVLCGTGSYQDPIAHELTLLSQQDALILCDISSPYRQLQSHQHWELLLNSITEEFWLKRKPETLITTGSFLLNKNLKNLIRKHPPKNHYHLADTNIVRDTFFTKPIILKTLGASLESDMQSNASFKQTWTQAMDSKSVQFTKLLQQQTELTDLWTVSQLMELLPHDAIIHAANSMSVRYVSVCAPNQSNRVYSNRGTSGIDGCLSTAIGAALADSKHEHFLISGDLAFFYDINGLWIEKLPKNLKIILLNNHCGNIFDMIPGPSTSKAGHLFTTPHTRTAHNIAQDFNIEYFTANKQQDFTQQVSAFLSCTSLAIFETTSDPQANQRIWKQLK